MANIDVEFVDTAGTVTTAKAMAYLLLRKHVWQ
jgi:hypothetical protein